MVKVVRNIFNFGYLISFAGKSRDYIQEHSGIVLKNYVIRHVKNWWLGQLKPPQNN